MVRFVNKRFGFKTGMIVVALLNLLPVLFAQLLGVNIVYVTIAYVFNTFALELLNYLKIVMAKDRHEGNRFLKALGWLTLFSIYFSFYLSVLGTMLLFPIFKTSEVRLDVLISILVLAFLGNLVSFYLYWLKPKKYKTRTRKMQSISLIPRFVAMLVVPTTYYGILLFLSLDISKAAAVAVPAYGFVATKLAEDVLVYLYSGDEVFRALINKAGVKALALWRKYSF